MVRSLTEPKIGPADHESPGIDELQLQARVREIANRWPAVGLAVGVVRDGSLEFFSGHGLANIASNTPITEDTVFRVGSLTKTFTAIAVLQLWEQGRIDLDAPANHYLRTFRLVPAKASFRPATVRQLLTHTAGIGEVLHPAGLLRPLFGETVKAGGPVPSLAEYYRGSGYPGRAGHPVPVHRPRFRHPRPARRGHHRAAPGPLPPRARLPAPRHGRHQPGPIRTGAGAPGDGIQAGLWGPTSGHRL